MGINNLWASFSTTETFRVDEWYITVMDDRITIRDHEAEIFERLRLDAVLDPPVSG